MGEQLARLQGHLVTFDGFALDYVEVATGPMTLQGHPMESGHHLAETDPKDLLGALPPPSPDYLPDTGAGTANHCRGPCDRERCR
jgi:hypothetical protein